jgi:hypothetical protein
MSISKARYGIGPPKSTNKYGRSNRRHFARQNHRKKTSDGYEHEKKPRKLVLSRFTGDGWIPCPSGYTRGQGWGLLHKAWIGYRISCNPRNGETFQDRLRWAVTIQNIQTDLGLQRTSFPTLGLLGDYVWAYNLDKELELQVQHDELWFKQYKKEKRAYIQKIVESSMLTEQEKEWMEEYIPQFVTRRTYNNENKYVEQIVMPNLFDIRRKISGTFKS